MKRLLIITILLFVAGNLLMAQSVRPVPHEVRNDGNKTLNLSKGVTLSDPKGVFADAAGFLALRPKGVSLTVDFGTSLAQNAGVKSVPGAYVLNVTTKSISVIGYDEAGAFHGLQTLRLLIEEYGEAGIPCCRINDWPDVTQRGLVDCYYGGTWSQQFRHSMISLAARLKMNTYVYAPENDPYVGSPDWILPYPQGKGDEIKVLIEECTKNRIDFVWCIRPDKEFRWSESDYALLLGKFEMMHFLGVRSFGILFDNVAPTEDFEAKKKALVDRLNGDFIAKKKGLKPLLTSLEGYYVPAPGTESLKLGMYGIADRAWNIAAYDADKSLEWAANEIAPDVASAYMTYAAHTSVSKECYASEESGGLELIGLKGFGRDAYDVLMAEFKKIETVPAAVAATANKALAADLNASLDEFGKLGTRCRRILECITSLNDGDIPGFWATYAANLMSDEDMKAYQASPSGTARLQPYYESMMKQLAEAFDMNYKGKVGYTYIPGEGIHTYVAPEEASVCHLVLDNPEKKEVIVRLSDGSGKYTAEFCINSSYFEFEMKEDAVRVEVIGDVRVFETVFVK